MFFYVIITFLMVHKMTNCNSCANTRKSIVKSIKSAVVNDDGDLKMPTTDELSTVIKKTIVGVRRIIRG
jgi:hypothetical protein